MMRTLRRHYDLIRTLASLACALGFAVVVGVIVHQEAAKNEQALHQSAVAACQRFNVKQVADNSSHLADYVFFTGVLESQKATAKAFAKSYARVLTPKQRQAQAAFQGHFLVQGFAAADAKEWVLPVSDCKAVSVDFAVPPAVPFYVAYPPCYAVGQKPRCKLPRP
jgi:hypothetical protein